MIFAKLENSTDLLNIHLMFYKSVKVAFAALKMIKPRT